MGIPDEPFWSPPDVVEAYRDGDRRARCRRRGPAGSRPSTRSTPRSGRRGTRHGAAPAPRAGRTPCPSFEQGEEIATRQAMAKVLGAVRPALPGPRLRRRRPHRQHRRQAARRRRPADAPSTRAGARSTTASASTRWAPRCVGHGDARRRAAARRHVLRVPRLHAPAGAPGRRCQRAKAVFVFSHDSVGVGEDGPTHQPVEHLATLRAIPRLQVIRPADANETVAAWRAAVDHDRPDGARAHPPGDPGAHRRLGRRARRRHRPRARQRHRALVIVATGSEVALAIDAAEQLSAEGAADAGREPAQLGPLRRARTTEYRARGAARRRARAVRRGGDDVRLGALRRRLDRHRPLRRQRARRRGARQARASTSTTSCERARSLLA